VGDQPVTRDSVVFLQTVSATCAGISGLFFLRFWRASRDPLFAFFCAAFWLIALSWALLALFSPQEEARPYIYVLRLVAFSLIMIGIVMKNARTPA
jgi:Family of unknown function (DUF5985)